MSGTFRLPHSESVNVPYTVRSKSRPLAASSSHVALSLLLDRMLITSLIDYLVIMSKVTYSELFQIMVIREVRASCSRMLIG